jgi:hypothetical protein
MMVKIHQTEDKKEYISDGKPTKNSKSVETWQ